MVDCRADIGVVVPVLQLLDRCIGGVGHGRVTYWCGCVEVAMDEEARGQCGDLQAVGSVAEFSLGAAALSRLERFEAVVDCRLRDSRRRNFGEARNEGSSELVYTSRTTILEAYTYENCRQYRSKTVAVEWLRRWTRA